MFRSPTTIREHVLQVAKVIFMLKHSVKLRRYILSVDVAACVQLQTCCHICWCANSIDKEYPFFVDTTF